MGVYGGDVAGRAHECDVSQLQDRLVFSDLKRYFFFKFERAPFEAIDFKTFLSSLRFSHDFPGTNRKAVFFGPVSYRYGHVYHPPRDIPANSPVSVLLNITRDVFPCFKFNSVLVNYYPTNSSLIRFHSDNEPEILANSVILTISLGCTRTMAFREKHHNNSLICKTRLEHGSVLVFTKANNLTFEHCILPSNSTVRPDGRISCTLRHLATPTSPHRNTHALVE